MFTSYSISNRSRLSRRSSAVDSFRTAWDSNHSRSTYEGRDNDLNVMLDDDDDNNNNQQYNDDNDEGPLYSPGKY
jgi:hypothetical protein